jgi:hypothetical protein
MPATTTPRAIAHHTIYAQELQLGDRLYAWDYNVGLHTNCAQHDDHPVWVEVATLAIDIYDFECAYVGATCGCQLVADGRVDVERDR